MSAAFVCTQNLERVPDDEQTGKNPNAKICRGFVPDAKLLYTSRAGQPTARKVVVSIAPDSESMCESELTAGAIHLR